jgi:hypothetical protein
MEEAHSKKSLEYTSKQRAVGELFYIFIVGSCLVIIVGIIWSILDFLMPTGKLSSFLTLNLGYQIAIVGGFLAGLFFLLIFFFGLFKKGSKGILKYIFKVRALEEKYRHRLDVKVAAGGLLISLIAIIIGIIFAIIHDIILGDSGSPFSALLETFTSGNWVLFGGITALASLGIALFLIYFWKNAYYLILRIMGLLEKEDQ